MRYFNTSRPVITVATLVALWVAVVTEARAGGGPTSHPAASKDAVATSDADVIANLCRQYSGPSQRVFVFGSSRAVSRKPASSKKDLARLFLEHRDGLAAVLHDRGLAITEPLARVIAAGDVTERVLEPGEVLEWMAFRPAGPDSAIEAVGPICLATAKPYAAWAIDLEVEEAVPPPPAACDLEVAVDCDARVLEVRATGGRAGLTAYLDEEIILDRGTATWTGPLVSPFNHSHVVTARGRTVGTKTVTTHHLVVPKVCLNLGLVGTDSREAVGDSDTCERTFTVARCPAPPPHCTIELISQAWRSEEIAVAIDGHRDVELLDATDARGRSYPAAGTMVLPRPGRYAVRGRATNEVGETAECSTEIVIKPRWKLRAMIERIDPDFAAVAQATSRPDGISERSRFSLAAGTGATVGLEYLFSDLVGLEGRLGYGELDSTFLFDLDDRWQQADDTFDLLALTIGPNFHLTRDRRADFFIGPFVGLVDLGTTRFAVLGEIVDQDFGEEFTFGVRLGLDVPLGQERRWLLHVGARYLDLATEFGGSDIDLDPLNLALGVGYGF